MSKLTRKLKIDANKIEARLKLASFILSLITLCWGVYQYQIENQRNFRKYVFELRSNTYKEYLTVCSELATTNKELVTSPEFLSKYKEYEKLHYGQMTLVQDTGVFEKATEFYVAINNFSQITSIVGNSDLQILLDELAKNCRISLKDTWTCDFDNLFEK